MRKNFYFTPYKYPNPEKYEQWLEARAMEGYYPDSLSHFNSMVMKLEEREPKKYRYVVDLQAKINDEYKNTYRDFGWEYVGRMSSIHVWRQEYEDIRPESLTDSQTKSSRDKRFVIAMSAAFWFILAAMIVNAVVFVLGYFGIIELTYDKTDIWVDGLLMTLLLGVVVTFIGLSIRKVKNIKK